MLREIAKIQEPYVLGDIEDAAKAIARRALELGFDPDHVSPFAQAAKKNGINMIGGKPDDVTVLLARVSR